VTGLPDTDEIRAVAEHNLAQVLAIVS